MAVVPEPCHFRGSAFKGAIRRATGRIPQALIHAVHHAKAAALVDGEASQIGGIAANLGLKDTAYFSRCF